MFTTHFILEVGLGILVFYLLLNSLEKRFTFRDRFQKGYGQGKKKVPAIIFSFILIVFFATLLQIIALALPLLRPIDSFVSGLRLGLLIYLLHIINPFIMDKN